jgi:LysR family transcriptional regulator, nitrogen assimilation regulatory protein
VLLRQLRYFMAVARAGSFVAASRQLNVSQPALGYQVKKLEEFLGVELLVRLPRGVALTPAGGELLGHGEAIDARLKQAIAAIDTYRSKPRTYLFGATPTPGKALIPDLLGISPERKVQIAIREGLSGELFNQVKAGQLDVAVCYDPPPHQSVAILPLYREDLFLVGPPALMGGETADIGFGDLKEFPLVLDSGFQVTRELIEGIAQKRGVRLNVALEIEPTSFKREILVTNRCCTVVPRGLFLHEIASGELNCRHIVRPSINRTLALIGRPGLAADDLDLIHAILTPIVARKIAEGRFGWRAL